MKKGIFGAVLASSFALFASAANALPTDCSIALTAGGQPQWIIGSAVAGHGFMLQNIDTQEAAWFSLTGPAAGGAPGSYVLAPSQARAFSGQNLFIMVGTFDFTGAVSVVAQTKGHKISCTWW